MRKFYPGIILNEINNYQEKAFKDNWLKLFCIKDVYGEAGHKATTKIIAKDYRFFDLLSKQLYNYVTNCIEQGDDETNALVFANLKLLKLEVDAICSEKQFDTIVGEIKEELTSRHGRFEEYVDEESGEILGCVYDVAGRVYYTDDHHKDYCQLVFKILMKQMQELLNSYGKSFDTNYSLLPRTESTTLSLPAMSVTSDKSNTNKIVIVPHKLFWDEEITEFEHFFLDPRITLMDGSRDVNKIFSIVKEVIQVGDFGGSYKNEINTPAIDYKPCTITDTLKWNGGTTAFAEAFNKLICFDSSTNKTKNNSTLFFNFSQKGVRDTIVKVLYSIFFITNKSGDRIALSYLKQAFKDLGNDQG